MKISRGKFKFLSAGMKKRGVGGWGRNEQKRGREELREYTLGLEERNAGGAGAGTGLWIKHGGLRDRQPRSPVK